MKNSNASRQAQAVFEIVKRYFKYRAGKGSSTKNGSASMGGPMNLLQIACIGEEKAVQADLYAYLHQKLTSKKCRHKGLFPISEYRVHYTDSTGHNRRTDIDIMVVDNNGKPIVAIQLKHDSPNRVEVAILYTGMVEDADTNILFEPRIPLIHLGLYTQVDAIVKIDGNNKIVETPPQGDFSHYRFIAAKYVYNGEQIRYDSKEMKRRFRDDKATVVPPELGSRRLAELIRGCDQTFSVSTSDGGSATVSGRVNYCLGLTV